MIRYLYYALKEAGLNPYFSLWLRYNSFIVLYPLGVAAECAMIYLAYPAVREQQLLTYPMPNAYNISFHYAIFVPVATFGLYLPAFA